MPPPATIDRALENWIDQGLHRIGEIAISIPPGHAAYLLSHHLDQSLALTSPDKLQSFDNPEDARAIALFDDHQHYRPLKTAPSLRRGWLLQLPDTHALRLALDAFYPAMVGAWFHFQKNDLHPVPLRETLNRQTGMYRFARNISDHDANEIVARTCQSETGCLKKILWQIDENTPLGGLPASKFDPHASPGGLADKQIPLLCAEACTFIVSTARKAAREAHETSSPKDTA